MSARSRILAAFALAATSVLAAPSARAQCGPDNLDGTACCAPATVALPAFPPMQIDSRWLCFTNCNLTQNYGDCAVLGTPFPTASGGQILCSVYDIRFRLKTCGTTSFLWNGSLKAYYSRTWTENVVVGGPILQVWRFIVNGDLLPTTLVPNVPCRRPVCLNNFTRLYVSGHIDYAFDCASGSWQVAFALSHECDSVHHRPGTARPAPATGLHPRTTFSIVGPGSTFVPAIQGPHSDGPINQGSIRWNRWQPAPQTCMVRERANGAFLASNQFCTCIATGAPQYVNTTVNVQGSCGSLVMPDPNSPFRQKRIGGWTSATQFPGQEFVLFDFGGLVFVNGCTATASTEWWEGSETIGGFTAVDINGLPLDPEFEDIGSCNTSITNPAPRIGAPHVCDYILNFNLP